MEVKKVNILGMDFKVTSKLAKGDVKEIADQVMGYCHKEDSRIWINPKYSKEHYWRTLFHEMGHATMYRNGINFSGMIPYELEEILVETFASVFYEFNRDYIKKVLKLEDNLLRDTLLSFCEREDKAGEIAELVLRDKSRDSNRLPIR